MLLVYTKGEERKQLLKEHGNFWGFPFAKNTFSISLTAASFHAFIGAVGAVLISIALPALRHTHVGAGTLESLRAAGLGLWEKAA